jgi:hypothetical protein
MINGDAMTEEPTQSKQEMYADDGYVEDGVADPGTMKEVDMSSEGALEEEAAREEGGADEPSALEADSEEMGLSTPMEQRQADPYGAVDMGYKEDPDASDSEIEGVGPGVNAETLDPLEET